MLVFDLDNTAPALREGITCFRCDSTINSTPPEDELTTCFCDFECETNLLAFADTSPSATDRTKDYFTLYYKSKDETATIDFKIGDTVLVDGVHGDSIGNGFIVDFTKIFTELGGGAYTLTIDVSGEFGFDFVKEFGKFQVCPFSELRADGTVKIKSIQNGNIESGFDFEDENVPFYIRLDGFFGNKKKVNDFIKTPNGSRVDVQVHDRWFYEYEFIFDTNKYNFVNLILDNLLAGDEVYFSDYNLSNMTTKQPFNNILVRETETDTEHVTGTNTSNYVVKLEDALKNNIKHPYIKDC